MQPSRDTLPLGDPARKHPARDPARTFAADAARRGPPEAPGRIIQVGRARIPSRPITPPRPQAPA